MSRRLVPFVKVILVVAGLSTFASTQQQVEIAFPLAGAEHNGADIINSVFDHTIQGKTYKGDTDGVVVAYSGERGSKKNGQSQDCYRNSLSPDLSLPEF
jgi:hypothetical protein